MMTKRRYISSAYESGNSSLELKKAAPARTLTHGRAMKRPNPFGKEVYTRLTSMNEEVKRKGFMASETVHSFCCIAMSGIEA
jgi:hypothetical protein